MAVDRVQSNSNKGGSEPIGKANKKGHTVRFAEKENPLPSVKTTHATPPTKTPILQVKAGKGIKKPLMKGPKAYEIKLTPKQQKKLAKQQIKARSEEIKRLKEKVEAHQTILKHTTRSGPTYLKVGNWQWKAKKKAPISDRMAAYLEMQKIKKEINAEKRAIGKLKQFVRNPFRKAFDRTVENVFASRQGYRGLKSKTGAKPILPKHLIASPGTPVTAKFPMPWVWYKIINEGLIGLIKASRQASFSMTASKALRELVKDGLSRLKEIGDLKQQLLGDPDALVALQAEEQELRSSVDALYKELERIPVVDDVGGATLAGMSSAFDLASLIQTFSILIPHWIDMGKYASYFGYVGIGVSIFTIPLAVTFTALGASATIDNLRTSIKDLFFSRGYSSHRLEQFHQDLERIDGLLQLPELNRSSLDDVYDEMKTASDRIIHIEQQLSAIRSRLLDGKLDKGQVKILKNLRSSLQNELTGTQDGLQDFLKRRLQECPDNDYQSLSIVEAAVRARRVAADSALAMQTTIMPFVKRKVTTKVICECVRGVFDLINIVGTSLTIIGFGMTVFGGAGFPIMAVGGAMALIGGYGQIATTYLVRKLRQLQLRGSGVSTQEFDVELMRRLKKEVGNWDALEANGLADKTNAAVMFDVLKKNYPFLPKNWGPREWATALVNDEPGGKERGGYYRALSGMKDHDNSSFLRRVVLWPVRKLRQRSLKKMVAIPSAG